MIARSRLASLGDVERPLGHEDARGRPSARRNSPATRRTRACLDPLVVRARRGRGQPAAVAAHHLVDDEHPRVGRVLGDDVAGEQRALLGGGPRAERLPDRHDVVVDGLGQPDDGQLVAVARAGRPRGRRRCRWCRRRRSCAGRRRRRGSAARRRRAAGPGPRWTRPRLTQSSTLVSLTRLLPIGLPPNACSRCGVGPHLVGDLDRVAGEQAGIAVAVGDDPTSGATSV